MARKFGIRLPKKLYPSGWPSNLRAILYLNKERRDENLGFDSFVPTSGQLIASTPISPSTEMSDYG